MTHLHSDHIADLATFYVGAMFGRKKPWEVWGPSGEEAATGTKHSIEGLRQVSGNFSLVLGWCARICAACFWRAVCGLLDTGAASLSKHTC